MNLNNTAEEHNARSANQRTCFLVYSSREGHVAKVIERLNDFLTNDLNFSVFKLDEVRIPGTQLLPNILKYAKECDISIVILDGLRPNVILELGMILAYETPCIILLERRATINIASLIVDVGRAPRSVPKIKIDVLKHISDISNVSWNEYSLQDDTAFRSLIRNEVRKLQPYMRKKQPHNHKRFSTPIRSLLRRIDNTTKLSQKSHSKLIFEAHKKMSELPKDQSGHIAFHIARSFRRRKEPQIAFREIVRGLSFDPNDDQLLVSKAKLLVELGQPEEGLRVLKDSFLKHPENKYLKREYLNMLNLNNKPKVVLKTLSRMTYEVLLINNLIPIKAEALFLNGQIIASLKLLVDMYEYGSDKWAIHSVMMLLYQRIKLPKSLPKELVAQIAKNVYRALENKHIVCYRCFTKGCSAIGLTDLVKKLSILWFENEKVKKAEDLNEFAFDLIELTEYKKAHAVLKTALKRFPNNSYLNATYGLYELQAKNNLSVGEKFYSKAIGLKPEDMRLKRMSLYQFGRFHFRNNDEAEAGKNYKAALDVQTDYMQKKIQSELDSLNRAKFS